MLKTFAKLTHSIGNFTLVPKGFNGFNGFRGTSKQLCDFWDLSLAYLENEVGRINFRGYINTFFLTCYLEKDKGMYKVMPFFSRGANNHPLPEGKKDLIKCLTYINEKIELRGNEMVAMLKKLK